MAAYAATARIQDVRPRRSASLHVTDLKPLASGRLAIEADTVELTGRSFDDRVRDWWTNAAANWAQTTFFLFDPESWR